tara:strand:+ start:1965 stop:2402 length:438 start_codon:yes stop_codon:yes gene_type:complete
MISSPRRQPAAPARSILWHQGITLTCLIVAIVAVGGLGLVWLRQQISDTAGRIQKVQIEQVDAEQRLEYLNARIARLSRPDTLHQRAIAMGLTLRRPVTEQVIRMGTLYVPAPTTEEPSQNSRQSEPYRQTFDLASMEAVRGLSR